MARIPVPHRDTGTLVVLVSALLVGAGSVLPWVVIDYVGSTTVISGIAVPTDSPVIHGHVTLLSGFCCVLLASLAPRSFGPTFALGNLGALIALVGGTFVIGPGFVMGSMSGALATSAATVSIGPYVTVLGGAGIVGGSLLRYASQGTLTDDVTSQHAAANRKRG